MKNLHRHAMMALAAFTAPLLLAHPAAAQQAVTGEWQVSGQINGHPFSAQCDFTPATSGFGGVCVDNKNKKHVLTSGTVSGDAVQFSYEASYLMKNFAVNFSGKLQGNGMAGTVLAAGRNGAFTATRG